MTERKEMQEKMLTYRILENRLDSFLKQREMVVSKLIEIQNTLSSMDEIEKSNEGVLFPIGAEAYTFGKVVDKKRVMVDIGANVILEKTVEEGKQILEKRKAEIENGLNEMQREIAEMSAAMEQLGLEIQETPEDSEAG